MEREKEHWEDATSVYIASAFLSEADRMAPLARDTLHRRGLMKVDLSKGLAKMSTLHG